jgi:hypothetical protein
MTRKTVAALRARLLSALSSTPFIIALVIIGSYVTTHA